ncbi:hypothetical protein O7635_08065 [Asanoa sp. WMMD1127]|uniref:hypothetical protein n=1 Tax=Asanoa sp. WMMD1127 TaxID=3016107 RepID=UPI0024164F8E|nr:hypothetical protein [Asanoa sp. WMMD1127]MDG4821807.1 hypothetical protein [Asanoa sp. WMMD1127]
MDDLAIGICRSHPQVGEKALHLRMQASGSLVISAMRALYDAEWIRATDPAGAADAWRQAEQACTVVPLRWSAAYAGWRLTEALLAERGARDQAAAALRRCHTFATTLPAEPLLAVSTHISHMLAKTGTANRVELAQLARRRGVSQGAG